MSGEQPAGRESWVTSDRVRLRAFSVIVAQCLALVLTTVWALGGFDQRRDTRIDGEVGTTYSLNVADVTILRTTASVYQSSWRIDIYATVQNTSGLPLTTDDLDKTIRFFYTDATGKQQQCDSTDAQQWCRDFIMYLVADDDPTQDLPRRVIPADSRAVPVRFNVRVEGTLVAEATEDEEAVWADNIRIEDGIQVALYPVYLEEEYILGISDSEIWAPHQSRADYRFWVVPSPIEVLEG